MPKAPTAQAVAKALAAAHAKETGTPANATRTAEAEAQRLRELAEAEARWQDANRDALDRGYGGLVPGTGLCWVGVAGCAHARAAAGLDLTDRDLEAIRRYPEPPPLIEGVR